ncbi:TIGR03503 family protein [Vibrio vulnificus]|nr:TIGR03503 family protein [Vibrio vulnificus]EGR0206099.1 TIGR03503 family protein [Vibrio vulnificus]EGR7976604.1 TIGR03503 family protein [Vibrio vulnificus]HAS8505425.1 TIGR03503 family protein [Vibrio vulnificus]
MPLASVGESMLRTLSVVLLLLVSSVSHAATESTMSLLDNRFRVDPTIDQITFLIYRENPSQPVVLVRPDGRKYYAFKSYPNVRWYQEPAMDIISIDNPMPGPWQAVGKVSPKNNIRLISHLTLSTDLFPSRLYHGEVMKFTARLASDDKPLVLRDFLDRVNLKVTFTKFVENEQDLVKEARPVPIVIGDFSDDGMGLDERAGDGVFTVQLPIEVDPGKYRARITSGNGVFLRAKEQEVLVYPSPVSTTFIQSRDEGKPHSIVVSGEQGMVQPGSLAVHIEQSAPDDFVNYVQGQADKESLKVSMLLDSSQMIGIYGWKGEVFATDAATQRPLMFPISQQTFSVVKEVDIEAARKAKEAALAEQRRIEEEQRLLAQREADRKQAIMMIGIGNVVVILLGLVVWFVWGKLRAKRQAIPEMQLEVPKK